MTAQPSQGKSPAELLASLPESERTAFLESLTPAENIEFLWNWRHVWARPNQIAPDWDWLTWVVRAGRGFGKALDVTTPIPTPSGWAAIGDLVAGDVVFDEMGAPCTVLAAHPVLLHRQCYRVVFSDGSALVADAEHLWSTLPRRHRKAIGRRKDRGAGISPALVTTADILATLYEGGEINHAIPTAAPLACAPAALPLDPYLFGCWLGDGHSRDAAITTADLEIVEAFRALGYRLHNPKPAGRARTWSIGTAEAGSRRDTITGRMVATGASWLTQIKRLGVWQDKHIPPAYLRASVGQRIALLQGLMDTDGSCSKSGHAEYTSVNRRLIDTVAELCVSLGFKIGVGEGRATIDGRDVGPKWRITWTPYLPVFRLPHKLARQKPAGKQALRQSRRFIVAVDPVESRPVRCITVDSPSALYLAGRSMIPTHNTRTGAEWCQERALAFPGHWMALIAKTPADARDFMIEGPSGLCTVTRPDQRPTYQPSIRRLVWPNGTWATVYSSEEPNQLRGFSGLSAWLDEFGKYDEPRAVWEQLSFGMREASTDRPRRLITTTPRPLPVLREIEAEPSTHVTIGSSYDNRANLDPTWFSQTLKQYAGTRLGRQEINAEYLDDVPGALWSRDLLDRTRVTKLPELRRVVVAVDPNASVPTIAQANKRSESTSKNLCGIVVCGLGTDGHGYVLEDLSGAFGPAEWASVVVKAFDRWRADRIIAEGNQGGAMVTHTLQTIRPNLPVRLVFARRGKQARAEPIAALFEANA